MIKLFSNSALWGLISQSDTISKIVLIILLVLSIVCWALFVFRLNIVIRHEKELSNALQQIKKVRNVASLAALEKLYQGTIAGEMISQNISFFESITGARVSDVERGVSDQEYEALQDHADQIFDDIMHGEESQLPFFSMCAAVSPLLGLFGTVWGLIHAFISISERQSADIATVAPGIAEALITTLAGLIVAIPALIMFHYLDARIKRMSQIAKSFSDRILMIIGVSSRSRGGIA